MGEAQDPFLERQSDGLAIRRSVDLGVEPRNRGDAEIESQTREVAAVQAIEILRVPSGGFGEAMREADGGLPPLEVVRRGQVEPKGQVRILGRQARLKEQGDAEVREERPDHHGWHRPGQVSRVVAETGLEGSITRTPPGVASLTS